MITWGCKRTHDEALFGIDKTQIGGLNENLYTALDFILSAS